MSEPGPLTPQALSLAINDYIAIHWRFDRADFNKWFGVDIFNIEKHKLRCPKCDSTSINTNRVEICHECNNCGHDWTTHNNK